MIHRVAGATRLVTANPQDQKLRETAQEFEALFVEMVFKRMRVANGALSGESKSFARSTYEEWKDQERRSQSAGRGALGWPRSSTDNCKTRRRRRGRRNPLAAAFHAGGKKPGERNTSQ